MKAKESKQHEVPEVTAAAAALVSMALCFGAFGVAAWLFGVAQGAVLLGLFFLAKGNRLVNALACKWTGHVMIDDVVEEVPPRAEPQKKQARTRQLLVIDHDPNEFRRSYR